MCARCVLGLRGTAPTAPFRAGMASDALPSLPSRPRPQSGPVQKPAGHPGSGSGGSGVVGAAGGAGISWLLTPYVHHRLPGTTEGPPTQGSRLTPVSQTGAVSSESSGTQLSRRRLRGVRELPWWGRAGAGQGILQATRGTSPTSGAGCGPRSGETIPTCGGAHTRSRQSRADAAGQARLIRSLCRAPAEGARTSLRQAPGLRARRRRARRGAPPTSCRARPPRLAWTCRWSSGSGCRRRLGLSAPAALPAPPAQRRPRKAGPGGGLGHRPPGWHGAGGGRVPPGAGASRFVFGGAVEASTGAAQDTPRPVRVTGRLERAWPRPAAGRGKRMRP